MNIYRCVYTGTSGIADKYFKTLKEAKAEASLKLLKIETLVCDGRKLGDINDLSLWEYQQKNWRAITNYTSIYICYEYRFKHI